VLGVLAMLVAGPAAPPAEATGAGRAEVVPGAGRATNYDSDGSGNCSFPPGRNGNMNVALSEVEYGTADACGAWLDVTGPNGTVRVEVTNRCPECEVGHLDLSREAFAAIAPLEAGMVDVTYEVVADPPVAEPIALRVKEGSSQWWLEIQVIDHGNQLASVELADGAGGWRSLAPSQHNYWTAEEPGPGPGPLTVRITDVTGASVTVDGVALSPGVVQRTEARLYGPGAGGGAAPTTVPPTTAPPTTAAPTTVPPATVPAPTTTAAPPTTVPATAPGGTGGAPQGLAAEEAAARGPRGGDGDPVGLAVLLAGLVAAGAIGVAAYRRRAVAPLAGLTGPSAPDNADAGAADAGDAGTRVAS
jgi:expansin (peptidoglycan-binding protein)